jgi:hypothetical protein
MAGNEAGERLQAHVCGPEEWISAIRGHAAARPGG